MKSLLVIIALMVGLCVHAQKRFSEGSMQFTIRSMEEAVATEAEVKGFCLFKGAHYLSKLTNQMGSATTFFDAREGIGAIHYDYGSQHIMVNLDKEKWQDKNAFLKPKDLRFEKLKDTLTILGFLCQSAQAKMSDSSILKIFYTEEIIPENTDVEWQFSQIRGLVLAVHLTTKNKTLELQTNQMSFDPVPIQKFDISNSGYRQLDYWESKKLK
jgi:hypothetical protein